MNILFLSLLDFDSIEESNIYTDLLRQFYCYGNNIYAISPIERRKNKKTKILNTEKAVILKQKIGNLQQTNLIEKGLSTVSIESVFIRAIKKYFSDVKFDLVIYTTPPITFCNVIKYVKKRDNAKSYLLLKDIFPQNAIDLEILSKKGLLGLAYKYFRKKEKNLYNISDIIGVMSPANLKYVLEHNDINKDKVEILPNCADVYSVQIDQKEKTNIRSDYGIPQDKLVFVYGGNLGRPQGINFMIDSIEAAKKFDNYFFLIVGSGTEYDSIRKAIIERELTNCKIIKYLPLKEYELVLASCEIGMIFLDYRFTIPNFPSRLLGYLQAKLPVLSCTDEVSDVGRIAEENKFGWWVPSNNIEKFINKLQIIEKEDIRSMGENGFIFLKNNYSSEICAKKILNKF